MFILEQVYIKKRASKVLTVYKYQPRACSHVTNTSKEMNATVLPKGKYRKQPEGLIFEYEICNSKFHLNAVKQVEPTTM
jgi:hypothetical protein